MIDEPAHAAPGPQSAPPSAPPRSGGAGARWRTEHGWADPVAVASALEGQPRRLCLLSDGGPGSRWSYVMAGPDRFEAVGRDDPAPFARLRDLLGGAAEATETADADGPPFAGGVAGLAAYDLAAPTADGGPDRQAWPGLILARHQAVLAFDHHRRRVLALGCGADAREAEAEARRAARWLEPPPAAAPVAAPSGPLAARFEAERPASDYLAAVADVVSRIAAGEIFQANIARAWSGELAAGRAPFDLFHRLAGQSPAPYAAFWDLGERALVSNSPESFLRVAGRRIEARPIKGTRPRGGDPATDAAFRAELLASAKDRAENLMIVDLMRNDLSRTCVPGTVTVPELFAAESFAHVHHLVSTVAGVLRLGADAADVMEAAFPPGSITGAPKHQAMKVIARHEAARGPWCGSLFLAGFDGSLSASVLIRTAAFRREAGLWAFRTLAGAGVVADSDPAAELAETEAKIAGIRRALEG